MLISALSEHKPSLTVPGTKGYVAKRQLCETCMLKGCPSYTEYMKPSWLRQKKLDRLNHTSNSLSRDIFAIVMASQIHVCCQHNISPGAGNLVGIECR
jgi:hypothetical protein